MILTTSCVCIIKSRTNAVFSGSNVPPSVILTHGTLAVDVLSKPVAFEAGILQRGTNVILAVRERAVQCHEGKSDR